MLNKLYIIIIIIILIIIVIKVQYYFKTIEEFTAVIYVTDDRTTGKYGTTCTSCPGNCTAGYYITGSCLNNTITENKSCTPCKSSCPAGKTLSGHCNGTSTSDKQCTPCPSGKYKSGDNVNECSPHISTCGSGKGLYGTNSTTSTKTCNPCPSGTYKSGDNGNECINCPVGTAVGTTGTDDICPDCESGTYQNQAGQSSCINCPSGYYCTNGSRTPHSSCTTDEVMEPGTSTSDTSCTECGNRGKHYSENRCYNTGRFPFFPSSCKERWEELLDHPFKTYKWRAFRHYYDDYYDEFHDLC